MERTLLCGLVQSHDGISDCLLCRFTVVAGEQLAGLLDGRPGAGPKRRVQLTFSL